MLLCVMFYLLFSNALTTRKALATLYSIAIIPIYILFYLEYRLKRFGINVEVVVIPLLIITWFSGFTLRNRTSIPRIKNKISCKKPEDSILHYIAWLMISCFLLFLDFSISIVVVYLIYNISHAFPALFFNCIPKTLDKSTCIRFIYNLVSPYLQLFYSNITKKWLSNLLKFSKTYNYNLHIFLSLLLKIKNRYDLFVYYFYKVKGIIKLLSCLVAIFIVVHNYDRSSTDYDLLLSLLSVFSMYGLYYLHFVDTKFKREYPYITFAISVLLILSVMFTFPSLLLIVKRLLYSLNIIDDAEADRIQPSIKKTNNGGGGEPPKKPTPDKPSYHHPTRTRKRYTEEDETPEQRAKRQAINEKKREEYHNRPDAVKKSDSDQKKLDYQEMPKHEREDRNKHQRERYEALSEEGKEAVREYDRYRYHSLDEQSKKQRNAVNYDRHIERKAEADSEELQAIKDVERKKSKKWQDKKREEMGESAWKENRTEVARINRYKRDQRKLFEKEGKDFSEEEITELANQRNEQFKLDKATKDFIDFDKE